jgi:hypothetical protein
MGSCVDIWGSVPNARGAEGESDRGGQFDVRPRTHDDCDTAEVLGIEYGGVDKGQERDSFGTGLWGAQAEFCRAAFLGSRIFCNDGGARRAGDPQLLPTSGEGRRETGAAWTVKISRHRNGGIKSWGRVSDPV